MWEVWSEKVMGDRNLKEYVQLTMVAGFLKTIVYSIIHYIVKVWIISSFYNNSLRREKKYKELGKNLKEWNFKLFKPGAFHLIQKMIVLIRAFFHLGASKKSLVNFKKILNQTIWNSNWSTVNLLSFNFSVVWRSM